MDVDVLETLSNILIQEKTFSYLSMEEKWMREKKQMCQPTRRGRRRLLLPFVLHLYTRDKIQLIGATCQHMIQSCFFMS